MIAPPTYVTDFDFLRESFAQEKGAQSFLKGDFCLMLANFFARYLRYVVYMSCLHAVLSSTVYIGTTYKKGPIRVYSCIREHYLGGMWQTKKGESTQNCAHAFSLPYFFVLAEPTFCDVQKGHHRNRLVVPTS